jgi:hypothetical protein
VPIFWKSGILNLLEHSGHVPACTGIATFYLLCIIVNVTYKQINITYLQAGNQNFMFQQYFNTDRIFQKVRIKPVRIVYLKKKNQWKTLKVQNSGANHLAVT